MFLTLKKMRQITISTYICIANKERRLVVKPVHLNFNYWREKIGCETGSSKFQLLEKDY